MTGVAAGAGAGTVTVALLGFGASTPDWKAVREDISDLINDPDVKNPSVDDGVQGKFSPFTAIILLDFLYVRFRMTFSPQIIAEKMASPRDVLSSCLSQMLL